MKSNIKHPKSHSKKSKSSDSTVSLKKSRTKSSPSIQHNIHHCVGVKSVKSSVQKKKSLSHSMSNSSTQTSAERVKSRSTPHVNKSKSAINTRSFKSNQSIGIQRQTSSLNSLSSMYNLTTGRYTASIKQSETLKQNVGHINQYGQSLYDCAVIFLACTHHKKLALSKIVNKGLYLPFGPIKTGESWINSVVGLIQKILNVKAHDKLMFSDPSVIDVLRIQVPTYFEFITRVSYYTQLTTEACRANFCSDNSMIAWFPMSDVLSKIFVSDYLGPEPALFYAPNNMVCREITIIDVLLYSIQGTKTAEGELLYASGYKEADIVKLYSDYIQHTYPSEFMTLHSFKTFLSKWELSVSSNYLPYVFKSFSLHGLHYINFSEFVLGLAMIDRMKDKQESVQKLNQFRSDYVFRYYAKRNAKFLVEPEIQRLLADYKQEDTSKLHKKMESEKMTRGALYSILCQVSTSHGKITMPNIFQSSNSPLSLIRSKQCYPTIHLKQILPSDQKNAIQAKMQRARELCPNCRSKQYTLSVHMVKMSCEGHIYEPVCNKQADVDRMSQHKRILSERYFTKSFVCNQMVDMIRSYASKLNINKSRSSIPTQDWDSSSVRDHCVDKILKICLEAKSLFQNGNRVIKVTSPCYVIGDLHGNLHDLLVYERAIWKLGPYFNPANYLFLGDYVDRGDYSVECILYLMCMKLLVPDRVFMLRGNHECRSLQKEFTFYTECKQKFGVKGEEVWEAFNDVFDVMPLCAVIDESIFCAHGGIPSCAPKIEQIMSVKSPMKDPENDSEIALEILWNDPVTNQEYVDLLKNGQNSSESSTINCVSGYLFNTKRGTACYYSEDALNKFLQANMLSHVIRAHEVIPAGYQYHMGGRCLTVFSCSHYCGGINEAAVAFVHDSKIRVMKVDTK